MTASPADNSAKCAVVLLSGGLDSAVVLAHALHTGHTCHTLAFDYGQRHRSELEASALVSGALGAATHRVFPLDLRMMGGSALTDAIEVPKDRDDHTIASGIPITYVPARNLIFLSIAMGFAEVLGARSVHIGVNALDYSGYPDCRPEFIDAFARTATLATKAGVENAAHPMRVVTPLLDMTKAQIITLGTELGVDLSMTHSCYDPDDQGRACGRCDSCALRARGFQNAGVPDPTRYAQPGGQAGSR